MRIEWLKKKDGGRVVVFFNGWGMDACGVKHLEAECDVMVVSDYRCLKDCIFPDLSSYQRVDVVAWSMGVWAAANLLPVMGVQPDRLIALNGTEHPVSDAWGIPVRIYQLTEKGMNEKGREKFLSRMLDGAAEWERFEQNKPQRELSEVCEELVQIRIQSTGLKNTLHWNKVYISAHDVIFPVDNQKSWWQDRADRIEIIPGGHYPFYQFDSWEQILGYYD